MDSVCNPLISDDGKELYSVEKILLQRVVNGKKETHGKFNKTNRNVFAYTKNKSW